MSRIKSGETERTSVLFVDSAGAGITGLSPTGLFRRADNGNYWDGAAWGAAATNLAFAEVDAVNLPGLYAYNFTPTATDYNVDVYVKSNSATYPKIATGHLYVGGWADELDAAVSSVASSTLSTVVESAGSITLEQALRGMIAVLFGATDNQRLTFKTPDGTTTRVSVTINGSNERDNVTLNL